MIRKFYDAIVDGASAACRFRNKVKEQPVAYILSGPPGSGKSTWVKKFLNIRRPGQWCVICKDNIRTEYFGINYQKDGQNERVVTEVFNNRLDHEIKEKINVIIDDCNLKENYIDHLIKEFKAGGYKIQVLFFNANIRILYWRNLKRWFTTNRFIPFKDLKENKKTFDKIDRLKYCMSL